MECNSFSVQVDIMVNNAGVMLLSPVTAFLQDEWERMLDVNVKVVIF
jgi:NADP-dependent 3-hydroxy acid dehydrogenase YdfG